MQAMCSRSTASFEPMTKHRTTENAWSNRSRNDQDTSSFTQLTSLQNDYAPSPRHIPPLPLAPGPRSRSHPRRHRPSQVLTGLDLVAGPDNVESERGRPSTKENGAKRSAWPTSPLVAKIRLEIGSSQAGTSRL
jgi:hypothetical protein